MRASVERSLRRLQTDYIDVLVWHNFNSVGEVSNPSFQEFMTKIKKEGKVRFTGFSAHSNMAALLQERQNQMIMMLPWFLTTSPMLRN